VHQIFADYVEELESKVTFETPRLKPLSQESKNPSDPCAHHVIRILRSRAKQSCTVTYQAYLSDANPTD
jgi:hypothetical protein